MNGIGLEMRRCDTVPGQALHGDIPGQSVPSSWSRARQARLILANPVQHTLVGGNADAPELIQQHRRYAQCAVMGQVFGHPHRVRNQRLSTGAPLGLVDHPQGVVNLWAVGSTTLSLPRLAQQTTFHQSYQTLPVITQQRYHLFQELPPGLSIRAAVASPHHPQILEPVIRRDSPFLSRRSLR